ncbi:MAG: hypothetical protein FGM58_09145 [Acidimicrobiia bacterium]|nr:hypothetical protein [Acidimicrobiia bacterium]
MPPLALSSSAAICAPRNMAVPVSDWDPDSGPSRPMRIVDDFDDPPDEHPAARAAMTAATATIATMTRRLRPVRDSGISTIGVACDKRIGSSALPRSVHRTVVHHRVAGALRSERYRAGMDGEEAAATPIVDFVERPFTSIDDLIWRVSWDARPSQRGRLHALSAFLAPPAAVAVILNARPGRVRAATAVYGFGLCAMFAASGAYHRLSRSRRVASILRRVDHSMIYVMIAGTWTPVAVAVLSPRQARVALGAVWGTAFAAIGAKVALLDGEHRAGSWFYPVLGVAGVALAPAVVREDGPGPLVGLAVGGAAMLGGAAVFAAQRPDPWPTRFGFHEIFHAAVVIGVASHFAAIWRLTRRRR